MTEAFIKLDGCNGYIAIVGGRELWVLNATGAWLTVDDAMGQENPPPGEWHMNYEPATSLQCERLAATNARDAQVEALEFVRGWATELVAQAAELRGTMEGMA